MFFMSTWWGDWKKNFQGGFFLIQYIRFEMHMARLDKSENIFGIWHYINIQSDLLLQFILFKTFLDLSSLSMCISQWINWIISNGQWQIKIFFNVLALENIVVALTREIGNGPWFQHLNFSCKYIACKKHNFSLCFFPMYFQCPLGI